MTRALVVGAGGQDGSYLVEQLLAEGVEVLTIGLPEEVPIDGASAHVGDVADVAATRALVLDLAPDEIYNLAAISSVARSWEQPDLTASVNGGAAVGLLETALQVQDATGRPVRFVQASSAEIFGLPDHSPQTERTPIRPVNPYGAAKAFAHLAVEVYRQRGLHATSLILYNHESPRRPPHFVTRKITAAVAAIAGGAETTLSLGNLAAVRDWGWAPDFTTAMRLAARAEEADDYVVATGEAHSVAEFVAAAFEHVGIDDWSAHVEVDESLLRPADAAELAGDSALIRTRLGWRPTVTFPDLVSRMVAADLELARGAQPSSRSPSR